MVKKNEEYKALMSEIDACKDKISDYETKIIDLLDKQEEELAEYKKYERTFSEKEKNIKDGMAELEEAVSEINEEIKRVESGRGELELKIETPILTEYRRLLGKNRGQPLAMIHDENCGNCHLKLTPQTITEARKGAVARCDHCAHMLYIQS
jgi:predicted  nucleic acid-binding Zn-ribbon protein